MECKERILRGSGVCEDVLIETSWNVKLFSKNLALKIGTVLIETSWNVKLFFNQPYNIGSLVLVETSWNVKGDYFLIPLYCAVY